jgi:hypothetical protein
MRSEALFSTVAADKLHFWSEGELNYQKVREFVDLSTKDVSRLAGVARNSVRYDAKAPKEVREHLGQVANICNLVFEFFSDDVKTQLWFKTPNPMLGNVSPRDMIRFGRYNKLLRFVTQAIEENSSAKIPRRPEAAAVQSVSGASN